MPDLTADSQELQRLADRQDDVAAEAGQGTEQSPGKFSEKLWETHGPISGPSNNAFTAKAKQRVEAGSAIQEACQTLAAALRVAAASYTGTDESSAADLNTQLRS